MDETSKEIKVGIDGKFPTSGRFYLKDGSVTKVENAIIANTEVETDENGNTREFYSNILSATVNEVHEKGLVLQ